MTKTGLIILQVLGALTFIPYPVVLVANVMSIAAPRQTLFGALPFILLSLYPLVWIALWVASWVALSKGAGRLAFGLSSVPVLTGLVLAAAMTFTSMRATKSINTAMAPKGSPLRVALVTLAVHVDGTLIGDATRQQYQIRTIRSLVERGEKLAPDEQNDLRLHWKLRFARHEGPITTSEENPLVWRILTRKRDGITPFQLRPEEKQWINQSTSLHGTPLFAALLQDAPDACRAVIEAGGRLSEPEAAEPAVSAALQQALARAPDLKFTYERAPR